MTKEQLNSIMTRLPESKVMIDAITVETDTPFKRIYISGKISGLHPEDARQNFQFAERELRMLVCRKFSKYIKYLYNKLNQ